MAKQVIIKGTAVVAANEVLVADSNSKIPAVDGSLVTAMSGTNVGSGTIATARLDTGTAANKIVVLDGSAKIPAVDGSLLTGIVAYTKSASDPTVSTNPSGGVGTEWVNHTTGKQFICTDATAGANVWSCSGSHSGDVVPAAHYQGANYGYHVGGSPLAPYDYLDTIQKYSFTSDGNATDVADLHDGVINGAGCSSSTHGYQMGGNTSTITNGSNWSPNLHDWITKFQFSSDGDSVDTTANLSVGRQNLEGCMSETHGYTHGGAAHADDTGNFIDKFPFASSANATDVGDLINSIQSGGGHSTTTYGYVSGGYLGPNVGTTGVNTIQRYSFSSDGNATDVGDLNSGKVMGNGPSTSATHGYSSCGFQHGPPHYYLNVIQKFSFASSANATDVGDSTAVRTHVGGSSSITYGYCTGGYPSWPNPLNIIDKYSFSTDGNATDVGDLATAAVFPSDNIQY